MQTDSKIAMFSDYYAVFFLFFFFRKKESYILYLFGQIKSTLVILYTVYTYNKRK